MGAKASGRIAGALAAAYIVCGPAIARAYCAGLDKSLPHYDAHYYSVPNEFRRSVYVVEVRVIRETWLGEDAKPTPLQPPLQSEGKKPRAFDPYLGAYYDVRVLKSFKGEAPAVLHLFSENSTGRFSFDVGSKQVLFVSKENFDTPIGENLTVDTCGNSRPFSKAAPLLGELRELASARSH